MPEQRFDYRVRFSTVALATVLAVAGLGGGGYAWLNGWGIRLTGVAVEPEIAQWFYLGFMVFGALLVILPIMTIVAGRRQVVVSSDRISLPKGEYSRRLVEISPADIRRIDLNSYNGIHTAIVKHSRGRVRLRSPHFDGLGDFRACVVAIEQAQQGSTSNQGMASDQGA